RLIEILATYFHDTKNCWSLQPSGEYVRRSDAERPFRSQEVLYESAVRALRAAEQRRTTTFEPHQPLSRKDVE
ncbi:MAG: polyphosphate kinase, partial [bacterium]|nr:polyphosphate kinase [bacterium]